MTVVDHVTYEATRSHLHLTDDHSPRNEGENVTLRELLAAIDDDYLDVVSAVGGLGRRVRGVTLWDAVGAANVEPGDLVLAVGMAAAPALSAALDVASRAGAAAVVVRRPASSVWVQSEAQRAGMTVLATPLELPWDELLHVLLMTIATRPAESGLTGEAPLCDMFALADAAAATLGGPVEIDDSAMRPVAYSHLDHGLDELRRVSILSRNPPASFMAWLRTSGLLQRLGTAKRPILVEPAGNQPRLAMPIRAGREILGYIWVSGERSPFSRQQEVALTEIAGTASRQIVRLRGAGDTDRRFRGRLLRSVLEGTGSADALVDALHAEGNASFRLIGFQLRAGALEPLSAQLLVRDVVAVGMEIVAASSSVVALGGRVYALVPDAQDEGATAGKLAKDMAGRAVKQLDLNVIAAVGQPLTDLAGLPHARAEVDRLLGMISTQDDLRVSTAEELRPSAVLAELRDMLASDRPHLLEGPIEILAEIDRTRKTDYLRSLRAYFDAQCDLTEASRRLCVHRNTLRYRIGRIEVLVGLDVFDPTERLVAELQLRLMSNA